MKEFNVKEFIAERPASSWEEIVKDGYKQGFEDAIQIWMDINTWLEKELVEASKQLKENIE